MGTALAARAGEAARVVRTGQTILTGLIGSAIGQSRAPVLHQSEAAAHGRIGIYRLIDLEVIGRGPEALPDLLAAAEQFGFCGLNITFPCKQAVIPHLHELSEHARALGAVNTVVLQQGRRIGHNTDWSGYAESLKADLPGADLSHVVLFGAGGAGAAVAYALLMSGVRRLTVVDEDAGRAEGLAAQLAPRFSAQRIDVSAADEAMVQSASGVVNATPVGMAKFPGTPFPAAWLTPRQWVSDIVYFPLVTELLAAARAKGCRTLDGSGMNVRQAAEAFRLFTGLTPDADRIRGFFDAAGRAA
ncbi:shikimate dehydrogenase [Alsobacter sp. R-9]